MLHNVSMGFHTTLGGKHQGIKENHFIPLFNAGIPIVFTCEGDYGICRYDALPCAVEGSLIAWRSKRDKWGGDLDTPYQSGNEYTEPKNAYLGRLLSVIPPEWHQETVLAVMNEVGRNKSSQVAEYALYVAPELKKRGIRSSHFGFSAGTPEEINWLEPKMVEFLRLCESDPYWYGITIHEYSYTIRSLIDSVPHGYPNQTGRWRLLRSACEKSGIDFSKINLLVKEFGWERGNGTDRAVPEPEEAIRQLDAFMKLDKSPNIKRTIWYLGEGEFGHIGRQTNRLIAPLTQWIIDNKYESTVYREEDDMDEDELIDVLPYLICSDGEIRPMAYNWSGGGEFPTQTQVIDDGVFDMVRGNQVQRMYYDDKYIYLEFDGTQNAAEFYTLQDDAMKSGSVWLDRFQKVGHITKRNPIVTHMDKKTCERTNGGWRVPSEIKLIARHKNYTLPSGEVARDVLQFGWNEGEGYFFPLNKGLAQWENGEQIAYVKRLYGKGDSGTLWKENICYSPMFRYYVSEPTPEPPTPPPSDDNLSFEAWVTKLVQTSGSYVRWINAENEPALRRSARLRKIAVQSSEVEGTYRGKTYVATANRRLEDTEDRPIFIVYDKSGGFQEEDAIVIGMEEEKTDPPKEGFRYAFWPVPSDKTITQAYGANPEYYEQFGLKGHEGVDIRTSFRAEIVSVAQGVVTKVGKWRQKAEYKKDANGEYIRDANGNRIYSGVGHNYGVHVKITHTDGFETTYAHLDSNTVEVGDLVGAGELIGYADSTGNSSGHHLHHNLKKDGVLIDPTPYLMSVIGG